MSKKRRWVYGILGLFAVLWFLQVTGLIKHPVDTSSIGYIDGQATAARAGNYTGMPEDWCKAAFTDFASGDVFSLAGEQADFLDGCEGKK